MIYKKLLKLNNSKTSNPVMKWEKEISRNFPKEQIQMANKCVKMLQLLRTRNKTYIGVLSDFSGIDLHAEIS